MIARRQLRWVYIPLCFLTGLVAACKRDASDTAARVAVAPPPAAYDSSSTCDPNGQWAVCSLMYRLNRAGFNVVRDPEPAKEKALSQPGMRLRLGKGSMMVFLYPDSVNRHLDEAHLDPKGFITPEADWVLGKLTLIHSANLLVLMDVANGRTRERIADALLAGPPQPPAPAVLPGASRGQ
jgi:hypothetical protein